MTTYTGTVASSDGTNSTISVVLTPISSVTPPSSGVTPPSSSITPPSSTVTPPSTGWPNAANTGVPVGTTLTNSGSVTITSAGAVVSGLNVTGTITVNAPNVTVKNCRINANGNPWGVDSDTQNATIQDCEIFNQNVNDSGVTMKNGKCLRLNIHGFNHGIATNGGLVQDCWIHDLGGNAAAHMDGVINQAGSGTIIRHNSIEALDTSCVFIKDDFTALSNITVDNNRLTITPGKVASYTCYSDARGGNGGISGVKFTNNVMQKGVYGYFSFEGNTPTVSGNVDWKTGATIGASQ